MLKRRVFKIDKQNKNPSQEFYQTVNRHTQMMNLHTFYSVENSLKTNENITKFQKSMDHKLMSRKVLLISRTHNNKPRD